MYCPNCHRKISGRSKACPFCGAAVRQAGGRGGAGALFFLLVFAMIATIQLRLGQEDNSSAAWRQDTDSSSSGTHAPSPGHSHAPQSKDDPLGSAGYLRGDVLLVSLYVNDEDSSWDEGKQDNVQDYLTVACEFLEEEAAVYGQELDICYDVAENPDLMYCAEFEGCAEEDRNGKFTRWIYNWIDKNVPVVELQRRYGTENIGFLVLVAEEGGAYTNVYYIEDDERYYNENSVLFYYYSYVRTTDREVPAVYAHEILHMFGAIDLYEDSPDFSPENTAYVAQTYPQDIMYSEYTDNGRLYYDKIHLNISPVTAYYLGWLDELPEADQEGLVDYERAVVAGFSEEDPTF